MVQSNPFGRAGGLAAILVLTSAAAGCGGAKTDAGSGSARVTAACVGRAAVAIAGVSVTVRKGDGADFAPIPSELAKDGSEWSGSIFGIPAGGGRQFDVVARDSDGEELCWGSAKSDVVAGEEASISVALLDDVSSRLTILSLVASQSMVAPGASASVAVVASDADGGGTLRYQWNATCGAFGSPTLAATSWTAPAAEGSCQLSVSVTSSHGTVTAYVTIAVGTVDRCAGVTCPAASDLCHVAGACTPATGLCSAETAKACPPASDLCHAAGTCTPATGVCSAETAKTCTPSDLCHVAGTCLLATGQCPPETAKTCPSGEFCDAHDGGQCKADRCVADHVTCPAASDVCHVAGACDPATGLCSAETPRICPAASDQCHVAGTCSLSNGLCSAETVRTCPNQGDVCNPTDGLCGIPVPTPVVERADGLLVHTLGLAYGADGAIYRCGDLSEAFNFGSGAVTPTPSTTGNATNDLWLGQFNPTGTGLAVPAIWAAGYGDPAEQFATGIARSSDRLGIIAKFLGSLDLGNGLSAINPDTDVALPTIALFDPATHAATYRKTVKLNGGQFAQIASNPLTNRFAVCGTAQDVAATDLVSGAVMGGGMDIVVAVLNPSGIVWAKQIGGTGNQVCSAVAIDDAGDVIIAGTHSAGALDFGAGAFASPTSANQHVYVAKFLGANGDFVRAVGFGPASGSSGRSVANGVAVAANGDVAVVGSVLGRITFGGITVIGTGTASADAYAVKLNAADYSVATGWPVRIGGSQLDIANSVAIDSQNRVWVAGIFSGITTSPGPDGRGAVAMTSNGGTDAFVVRFAPDATVQFSDHFGDTYGQSSTMLVSTRHAPQDVIWMGGTYASQVQFGSLPPLTTTSGTDVRAFLVKFQ